MKRYIYKILNSLSLTISGFLVGLSLSEWFKVKIMNRVTEYRFGSEGPYPYFYKSAELYAIVNLIWGLLFLTIIILSIWSIAKHKKNLTLIIFLLTILLLFAKFIQGLI